MYDPRIYRFIARDPKWREYMFQSPYVYAVNNPIRYTDVFGEGPGDRIKAAKEQKGKPYKQQTELELRTGTSKKALEFLDCSELICRILAADEFTDGVENMPTPTLQKWMDANWKEVDQPKRGDIIVWNGHTALVTADYEEGEKIAVIHATKYNGGKVASVVEEKYSWNYYQGKKGKGMKFYTPKNEMPDDLDEKSKDKAVEKAKMSKWELGWKVFKTVIKSKFSMSKPQKAKIKTPEPSVPSYTVTAEGLNFRKSSGAGNDKLNPLKKGEIVKPTGNTEGTWMEVKTENGRTGWISSKPKFTKKN
jgi:hypothetical protein